MKHRNIFQKTSIGAIFITIAISLSPAASGATFTWTGGSIFSNNWSDGGNWTSIFAPNPTPTSWGVGWEFFFTGTKTASHIDQDFSVTGIQFNSGVAGMNFTGSKLTLFMNGSQWNAKGITNLSTNTQTFNNNEIVFSGPHSISASNGNLTFNSKISINGNYEFGVKGANNVYFNGGFEKQNPLAGTIQVNKSGTGQLRLRSNCTGIEQLNVTAGEVLLSSTNNPTLNVLLDANISTGATFNLNNNNTDIDKLEGSGAVSLGSGTLTLGDESDFTFWGQISGTGGIIKNKGGTMTLRGVNTYTGPTSITNGAIRLEGSGSLSSSTNLSVSSGATFNLNGVNDTLNSISGAGSIQLGEAVLAVNENSGTRTFSGNISQSGKLQKDGGGTLILSGDNTFTLLDINAGILQFNSSASMPGSTIELGNATLRTAATFTRTNPVVLKSASSTIEVNPATTLTMHGVLSGLGGLRKHGDGTLVLAGVNTYTNNTIISAGTIRLAENDRIANSSNIVLSSGATLDLNNRTDTVASLSGTGGTVSTGGSSGRLTVNAASGTFTWGGNISGAGGFTKNGNHTLVLSTAQSYSGATAISSGILQFTGSGSLSNATDVSMASGATWNLNGVSDSVDSISGAGSIQLNGATLSVNETTLGTRTFSGIISGPGSFGKNGAHTLVLSGNNTIDGEIYLQGGTLSVANSTNLGAVGSTLLFFGGTLQSTASFTNGRSVLIGPFNSGTFNVNSATTLTQSGTLSGDSATTLTKTGGGTLRTTAANGATFTGSIVINDGTFDLAGSGDAIADLSAVTVNSPGTFLVNNPDDIGSLAGSGSTILNTSLRAGANGSSTTYSGVISGTGLFGKLGGGIMTLAGNNTYTGTTSIVAGTLRLSGAGRTSDLSNVNVASGATFDLNGVSNTSNALIGSGSVLLGGATMTVGANNGSGTFSGSISGAGNLVKTGSGIQTLSGSNTYTGTTSFDGGILSTGSSANLGAGQLNFNSGTWRATGTLSNSRNMVIASSSNATINVNTSQTLTHSGSISGTSANLIKQGAGTLVVAGATSYGGATNIHGGILRLQGSGRLPATTDVSISGATWDLNGISDTVSSISGNGTVLLGGGSLTVTQNGGSRTFGGPILGSGAFLKTGTHTLTLSGSNDYSGPTTIAGGQLRITQATNLGSPSSGLVLDGGTLHLLPAAPVSFGNGRFVTLRSGGGTIFLQGGSSLSIPGVIVGPGALTVASDNNENLVLSGDNAYQGGTLVDNATLSVSQNSNLGNNFGAVTLNTGTLQTNATFTNQHPIVLSGQGRIAVNTGTLTQAAGISGSGNFLVDGPGIMRLTQPATHAGDTSISANATLRFGTSGSLPDAYDVTVDGLWDLNGASDTINGLFGGGTVLLSKAALTLGAADGGGNFSGSIQGIGAITKTGTGTQILSGANSHTAVTTIGQGTLEITDNNSLGALSAALVFESGILQTNSTFETGRTTTLNGTGSFATAAGTTLTFTSPIGGAGGLSKLFPGTLELTQPNTYGGNTLVNLGTLRLSGAGRFPDTTDVALAASSTLDMTDVTDAIDSLTGSGTVQLGTGTLTIGSDNGGGVFSGVITGAGLGGTMVKTGNATAAFTGANTYAGGTHINGGTLQIAADENLGKEGSQVAFDGGTLHSTASFSTVRSIDIYSGGGTIKVETGNNLDASGSIAGTGALTKLGEGTLVLGGISTYDGGTNILEGVLSASSSHNLGADNGQLTIDGATLHTTNIFTNNRLTTLGAGGATIEVDLGTTHTHNGVIQGNTGTNGFSKTGGGILRLNGANTFMAPLHLATGTLQATASPNLGDAANPIVFGGGTLAALASFNNPRVVQLNQNGGVINVAASFTLTQSGVIGDGTVGPAGNLVKAGTGILQIAAPNTYSSGTTIQAGILQLTGSGSLPVTTGVSVANGSTFDLNNISDSIDALAGSGEVTLGSGFLTIGSANGEATFSGTISGTGGLAKTGNGTQLLQTKKVDQNEFPNTYSGGTAFNGGTLDVETDTNLGDPAGPLSFSGGTLQVAGVNNVATSRLVTLNPGGGTIHTVGQFSTVTLSGIVSGSGSLTKNGGGTLTYAAEHNYTGDTLVLGGRLNLTGTGRIPDASSVTVNASGTMGEGLDLNNISDAINGLNGTGNINLRSATLTVGALGGGGSFSGTIIGTGGFTKVGAGHQVLSGANTYSGSTNINGGLLQINADNRLGAPTGTLSFDGGTLVTTGTFGTSRATTVNAGGGTFQVAAASVFTHGGQITGPGGLGKNGTGTLVLSNVNFYDGDTTIGAGTLRLAASERLPNTTSMTIDANGVFDMTNFNETMNGLSGAGTVKLGIAQLTVGISDGGGVFTGVIEGTGNFQKEGTGTQTLTGGAHTYSGATVVNGGTLILNGGGSINQTTLAVGFNNGSDGTATASGSGTTWDIAGQLTVGQNGVGRLNVDAGAAMTVGGQVNIGTGTGTGTLMLDGGTLDNTGGTGILVQDGLLGGNGEITGSIINQDTVAPGNSPGVLDVTGTYVQESGGTFSIEVGGTGVGQFDAMNISGTASLDGTLELGLLSFEPAPGDTFTILTAGSVIGQFANVAHGGRLAISSGGTGSFQVDYTATSVVLSDFQGTADANSFDAWIDSFPTLTDPADKLPGADPDGDGMPNFVEFALDSDPTSGGASGKYVGKIGQVGGLDVLSLTFPVRIGSTPAATDPPGGELVLEQTLDGITYTIQASDDLDAFTLDVSEVTGPDATAIQAGLPGVNPGWEYRTFRSPGTVAENPTKFMLVVVTEL